MQAELVECWLCEATIAPMGRLSAIVMSRGGSIRGRTGEGAGRRKTSVARAH